MVEKKEKETKIFLEIEKKKGKRKWIFDKLCILQESCLIKTNLNVTLDCC